MGTPTLGPDGTLWLVLEARNGGGARLALRGTLKLWSLPPTRPGGLDGWALALTRNSVVVVSPNGTAATLDLARQATRSVTLPGFSGALTLTPLGEVMAVNWEHSATVILDSSGFVQFRLQDVWR